MLLGSHVSISGGLLGAAQEAASYGASAFMIYTGAPQNAVRKSVSVMKAAEGLEFMRENGICGFVVHAPYIVNPASAEQAKRDFAVEFLRKEMARTAALGAKHLVLHPGSAAGQTQEDGIKRVISCVDEILDGDDSGVVICFETMAGKGGEVGRDFGQINALVTGVKRRDRVGVCFDTCHVHDAGYALTDDLDGVMAEFDKIVGLDKIKIFHLNGSLNPRGAKKDRHANLGAGDDNPKGKDFIGFNVFYELVRKPYADGRFLILETPWTSDTENLYRQEIAALRGESL